MKWAQTFFISAIIMLSCFCQIENASYHAKWERMYLSDLDDKLGSIELKLIGLEYETKKNGNLQLNANGFLSSIKVETAKSRTYLDAIQFQLKQNDNELDVKTQFANGKIGRK